MTEEKEVIRSAKQELEAWHAGRQYDLPVVRRLIPELEQAIEEVRVKATKEMTDGFSVGHPLVLPKTPLHLCRGMLESVGGEGSGLPEKGTGTVTISVAGMDGDEVQLSVSITDIVGERA